MSGLQNSSEDKSHLRLKSLCNRNIKDLCLTTYFLSVKLDEFVFLCLVSNKVLKDYH